MGKFLKKDALKLADDFFRGFSFNKVIDMYSFFIGFSPFTDSLENQSFLLEKIRSYSSRIEDYYSLYGIQIHKKEGKIRLGFEYRYGKFLPLKDLLNDRFLEVLNLLKDKEWRFMMITASDKAYRFEIDVGASLPLCIKEFRYIQDLDMVFLLWILSFIASEKRVERFSLNKKKLQKLCSLWKDKDFKDVYVSLQLMFDDLCKLE